MTWIITTFNWYIYLLVLGILFFPLTSRIFKSYLDRGYPFAKTLSIIITTYTMFLLGSMHILPFTKEALLLILFVFGTLSYKFLSKEFHQIFKLTKQQYVIIAFEEILFILSLLALTFIRGQEPAIHGLEKFMDYGFIQSILNSTYFPPLDMWLSADLANPSGYPINYYYFGHMTGAFLIRLTDIKATIGYNLILATILAQGMTLTFSIVSNLIRQLNKQVELKAPLSTLKLIIYGTVGAITVNLAGNLHTIYIFTKGYPNESPEPFWGIFQSLSQITATMTRTGNGFFESMVQNSSYWYPNATRFIPFTIHEFPSYSYIVADLHGHVFEIPFVLLTFAIIFLFFTHIRARHKAQHSIGDSLRTLLLPIFKKLSFEKYLDIFKKIKLGRIEVGYAIAIGAMIAVNYMTNAFDGPIYLLLVLAILFYHYRISWNFIIQSVVLAMSFLVFSFPFSLYFSPFATGVGVNCSPDFLVNLQKIGPFLFEKNNCQLSSPWMMLVLWGFFWISLILLGIYFIIRKKQSSHFSLTEIDRFLLIIFGYGTFLIIIPEFIYAKDIYPAHFRANTMFKMGYQAFMMMGITSTVVLYRIGVWSNKILHFSFRTVFIVFFALIAIYPYLGFPSYYPGLFNSETYKKDFSLDGLDWMETQHPEDKELIDFIMKFVPRQVVIAEAQGDSYTDYNRISAFTGNPTIAGWWVHEWLWRGSSEVVGKRIPDVEALYQSDDLELTRSIIKKYQVEYIVVSTMERDKYSKINEDKMSKLGIKLFESSNGFGALYKVY